MADGDKWQEKVKRTCTDNIPWWWFIFRFIYLIHLSILYIYFFFQSLFAIVAAVLHLGNITHVEDQRIAKLSHNGHETYVADVSKLDIFNFFFVIDVLKKVFNNI